MRYSCTPMITMSGGELVAISEDKIKLEQLATENQFIPLLRAYEHNEAKSDEMRHYLIRKIEVL